MEVKVTGWLETGTICRLVYLYIWCLGWDCLNTGATEQHLHVASLYGLAPFQHNVLRIVGILTRCLKAPGTVFHQRRQKLHCLLWQPQKVHNISSTTLLVKVIRNPPRFKGRECRRTFGKRVAGSYHTEGGEIGDMVVTSLEDKICHNDCVEA